MLFANPIAKGALCKLNKTVCSLQTQYQRVLSANSIRLYALCKPSIKGCAICKLSKNVCLLQTQYQRVCYSQTRKKCLLVANPVSKGVLFANSVRMFACCKPSIKGCAACELKKNVCSLQIQYQWRTCSSQTKPTICMLVASEVRIPQRTTAFIANAARIYLFRCVSEFSTNSIRMCVNTWIQ